jgi:hypothetical protein
MADMLKPSLPGSISILMPATSFQERMLGYCPRFQQLQPNRDSQANDNQDFLIHRFWGC